MVIQAQDSEMAQPLPSPRAAMLTAIADGVCRTIDTLLGAGMILGVLLNFANVVARYVLGIALVGADEILVYGMISTIFLGAVSVTWRNAHLRMDVLIAAMPARMQRAAAAAGDLTLAGLAGMLASCAAYVAHEMALFDQRSLAAGLPMVVPHAAVALGLGLVALVSLLRLFGVRPSGEPQAEPSP